MREHLSDSQFQNYNDEKITPEELIELDDHLLECESCRTKLGEITGPTISFHSLRASLREIASSEPGHLSYEQLEAIVDGKLDRVELENVQSHLDICPQCLAEEQDLRVFKTDMYQKVTSGKVLPFWRSPALSIPLRVAGAAAAIAVFVWLITIPMRNQINDLRTQLQNERNNTAKLLNENRELQKRYAEFIASQKSSAQATVLIALNDGDSRVQLDQDGNLTGVPPIPALYQQKIVAALTRHQVETPQFLHNLIGKQETLMGNADTSSRFLLLKPVGTVVQEGRPTFEWEPLKGADGYRISIYDENYSEVGTSPLLKETTWTIPQALKRGTNFNWQVAAIKGGKEYLSPVPPAPEAKFQILSEDKLKELQRIKETSANSHLVMGTLYAQQGLLDDAESEFSALSRENPHSETVKKLLASVESLRPNR